MFCRFCLILFLSVSWENTIHLLSLSQQGPLPDLVFWCLFSRVIESDGFVRTGEELSPTRRARQRKNGSPVASAGEKHR